MKKLRYFKLPLCPYCIRADIYMKKLIKENPDYQKIDIEVINESKERSFADSYNYFLVPAFFLADKKLHEGAASYEDIKRVLDEALKSQ